MADFFISYTSNDSNWAQWIAKELTALGHAAHVHEWEIGGGSDIYAWMEARLDAADHVLCVVSDEYLKAPYSRLERNAALWQAASSRPGFVLFVVVKPCRLPLLSDHIRRCELFGMSEEAARIRFREFMERPQAANAIAFPGKVVAASNIPIRLPTHFLGRDRELAAIEAALRPTQHGGAIAALIGMRGVGKTTLAAGFAESHRGDYRATWWIRAQAEPGLRADLVALGIRLGWIDRDEKEEPALAAIMERLRQEGEGILLIFDNAPDANAIRRYLPRGGNSQVLVTSNAQVWRGLAVPVEIGTWPKSVGADYLIARTGQSDGREAAEALSQALGGLPLAHEQAAAYCERLEKSLADYRKLFERAPTRLLDDDRDAPAEYHDRLTVAKTFVLAIEEAAKLHPAVEPLIVHAALLAPEPIPLFLFAEASENFGPPLSTGLADEGLDEIIAALRAFALVERVAIADERDQGLRTDAIQLHRLVRQIAAARREGDARQHARRSLISALAAVYPQNVFDDPKAWPLARRLDALALGMVADDGALPSGTEDWAGRLLNGLAAYRHQVLADYAQARLLYQRALTLRESVCGPDHPDTAEALNNFALLLQDQGDFAEARPLLERALRINATVLGPEHPSTATSTNNLALLLQAEGDLAGARPLYERALEIYEKNVGPDHPSTATALNNLALLLKQQGDLAGAQALYERALSIDERALGAEHPDIATDLINLAVVLEKVGNRAQARTAYERALVIREKALGPEHPQTIEGLDSLAALLHDQGALEEAERMCQRSLEAREKVYGADDVMTAKSVNNLAALLQDRNKPEEARQLYERALAIDEGKLGSDHPSTNRIRRNLARLLLALGRAGEALALAQLALAGHKSALGTDNDWTKDSARVAADALVALGHAGDAEALRAQYALSG